MCQKGYNLCKYRFLYSLNNHLNVYIYMLTGINSSKQCGEYYFRGIMYTQLSASKHDKKISRTT